MKSETLRDLGEDEVVRRLISMLPPNSRSVRVGPGDDCAVIEVPGVSQLQLLKTDTVVEGVHFCAEEKMERVGWKALCRAISDMAGMGGLPESALITVIAPAKTQWQKVKDLYRGIGRAASKFGVSVVGGETSQLKGPLVCSVALTGWVKRGRCVRRSGGRVGDALLVTGRLGGSLRTGRHLDFTPRLKEAAWLVEHFLPRAMMDISDGLGLDGSRLAAASGCSAAWDLDCIPRTKGCSLQEAFTDGEDFELLLAVAPRKVTALLSAWKLAFRGTPLTRVGSLVKRLQNDGGVLDSFHGGYDHFQKS